MKRRTVILRGAAGGIFCLLLGSAVSVGGVGAQSVRGRLKEEGTERFIPSGAITLLDAAGVAVETTLTNRSGRFSIGAKESGSYSLSAAAIGYARATAGPFDLTENQVLDIELQLEPSAITLPGIRIEVERARIDEYLEIQGFYTRRDRGHGYFFTSDDIEKINPIDFSDLFFRVPGVWMAEGWQGSQLFCASSSRSIENPGPERPRVYLDGLQVPSSNLRTLVRVRDVAAIEVYKGGASLPVQFSATGASCVVLVWTKG